MTNVAHVPGLGLVTEDSYGALLTEPHSIRAFGGKSCRFELQGYETDPHPEDFVLAVRNIIDATEELLNQATPYVAQYCSDMIKLYEDEAPDVQIDRPEDVWLHVDFGSEVTVSRSAKGAREIFVSIECNCTWEVEHGLQLVFRDGREIWKVGPLMATFPTRAPKMTRSYAA